MQFQQIHDAGLTNESDRPLMQKAAFPVSAELQVYLRNNGRDVELPVSYADLLYYSHTTALRDKMGKLTHWEHVVYDQKVQLRLNRLLLKTYALLKGRDMISFGKPLQVLNIDFCEFGNSVPFRISVLNKENNNVDYFYVKLADASRIYGLELENLLSPDSTNFFYHSNTLVEDHIQGVAGDLFLKQYKDMDKDAAKTFAKEFVQFNERCFARLLGDMRSYNFAVKTEGRKTPYFRIRPIDFDQQSYEGKKRLYLPQFYKENSGYVQMVLDNLDASEIVQYQLAERRNMKDRVVGSRKKLMDLLNAMVKDELSENYKVLLLRKELNEHFKTDQFSTCKTMGAIVKKQLKLILLKSGA